MEASATYHGLKLAQSRGYDKVWVEGDSLNIINNLRNISHPSWMVESLINDALNILDSFNQYFISHVYKEGNRLADFFANYGVNDYLEWGEHVLLPLEACSIIHHELQRC